MHWCANIGEFYNTLYYTGYESYDTLQGRILKDIFSCLLFEAFDLTKDQKQSFGDDITGMLRMAKKKKFSLEEEKRIKQEISLQTHLNGLLLGEKNRFDQKLSHVLSLFHLTKFRNYVKGFLDAYRKGQKYCSFC